MIKVNISEEGREKMKIVFHNRALYRREPGAVCLTLESSPNEILDVAMKFGGFYPYEKYGEELEEMIKYNPEYVGVWASEQRAHDKNKRRRNLARAILSKDSDEIFLALRALACLGYGDPRHPLVKVE